MAKIRDVIFLTLLFFILVYNMDLKILLNTDAELLGGLK